MASKSSTDSPATDQASESVQALLDRITEHAAEAEARIRTVAKEAQGGLRHRADDVQKSARAVTASVEDYIHEHPVQALGIAFVGGIFLSSLLKRR